MYLLHQYRILPFFFSLFYTISVNTDSSSLAIFKAFIMCTFFINHSNSMSFIFMLHVELGNEHAVCIRIFFSSLGSLCHLRPSVNNPAGARQAFPKLRLKCLLQLHDCFFKKKEAKERSASLIEKSDHYLYYRFIYFRNSVFKTRRKTCNIFFL